MENSVPVFLLKYILSQECNLSNGNNAMILLLLLIQQRLALRNLDKWIKIFSI